MEQPRWYRGEEAAVCVENKPSHNADPLRKRAAECIFPPAPASHSQVDIVINSRTISSSQRCVVVRK